MVLSNSLRVLILYCLMLAVVCICSLLSMLSFWFLVLFFICPCSASCRVSHLPWLIPLFFLLFLFSVHYAGVVLQRLLSPVLFNEVRAFLGPSTLRFRIEKPICMHMYVCRNFQSLSAI